jgi:type II secretory pathway component PulC
MKVASVDDLQRLMVLSATPEMKLEVWRNGARRDLYVRPKLSQAVA